MTSGPDGNGDILVFPLRSGPAARRPPSPNAPPSAGHGPPTEDRAARAMPPRYSLDVTRYNGKSPTFYIAANASRRCRGGGRFGVMNVIRAPPRFPVAGCRFPPLSFAVRFAVAAVVCCLPGPRSPVPDPAVLLAIPQSEIRNPQRLSRSPPLLLFLAAPTTRAQQAGRLTRPSRRPLCHRERYPYSTPVPGCRFPVPAVLCGLPGP